MTNQTSTAIDTAELGKLAAFLRTLAAGFSESAEQTLVSCITGYGYGNDTGRASAYTHAANLLDEVCADGRWCP